MNAHLTRMIIRLLLSRKRQSPMLPDSISDFVVYAFLRHPYPFICNLWL